MGWYNAAKQLVMLGFSSIRSKGGATPLPPGVRPLQVDLDLNRAGHRAIDIACFQRWSVANMAHVFGRGTQKYCADRFPEARCPRVRTAF
jgi:hypothetical protein